MKKFIGYGLICAYLVYFIHATATKYQWHAVYIIPLTLLLWIGVAFIISWLIK